MLRWGVAAFFMTVASALAADWVELKNCRVVENSSNDADSFVVEGSEPFRGEKQNRFRLYFVDAAETDANSKFKKDRLKEQADYWGSQNLEDALRMGLRAEQFVKRLLRGNFSVHTQGEYAPTMGRPRYYAMVRIKDRWLDEILVEEGLVRIYGKGAKLPDGTAAKTHWRKLYALERASKTRSLNGWHNGADAADSEEPVEFDPHDAKTIRTTWIYSSKTGQKVTALPKGTVVSVLAPSAQGRFRVRFEKSGKVYEGLCEKKSLIP